MRKGRLAASLVLAALTLAGAAADGRAQTPIAIEARPITAFDPRDASRTRFGALEFRGGLALTSNAKAFGGLSALHVDPDGEGFLAVTDKAAWLRGRIVYRDGTPAGIADAEMAPLLAANGKPLDAQGWYDSEALAARDGRFYVGIERVERIVRFDLRRHGLRARSEPIPVPDDFKIFTANKGLECLAAPPPGSPLAGDLIAITERSLDAAGNIRAFVLADGDPVRFSVKRSDDFDVTDCAVLPPRDLLLLERRYSPLRGVAMRIRRLPLKAMGRRALLDGPVMIEADLAYEIDNMEGIALHRNARGETILTLVSDDNFSPLQRTLLLQFRVAE